MRTLAELRALRGALATSTAWPFLLSVHRSAEEVDGAPFTQSIFTMAWNADVPAARVTSLLAELADAGALECETRSDGRTFTVTIL